MCGVNTKSIILIKAIKANNDVKLLTKQEIDILAERFEIGGRVHYGHFIHFFKEMNNQKSFNRMKSYKAVDGSVQTRSTRPKQSVGLSPFRMSSEWASLKEDVLKNKTYKLNDTSPKMLESVSEKGRSTYTNKSSTDNRNANNKNKNKIEMLNENEYEDEDSYDASSPQTSQYTKNGKQKQNNFRERVRDRRENHTNSNSSAGHDEWRESRDGNLSPSSPSDSKNPNKSNSGDRGRSQKTSLNNYDLPDTSIKKNIPPPKPARNTPGKHNDALVKMSPKKSNNENNKNNRDRDHDNNDRYDKNDNRNSNKTKNNYNNDDNDNDYDDDDDDDNYYNRNTSDKKRNIISGSELDFKSDVRGRSVSPRDLRDRNKNQNQNQNQNQNKDHGYDNRRRRDSENDRGRGSERGRRSPSEAKNIPSRRSSSPDDQSSPENVAVNRRSWRRSLTDSMMWSKSQTMLVDNNDVQGPLKLPQRAQSPDGKGVTKYFPWNKRSNGDSGRSSPVAL